MRVLLSSSSKKSIDDFINQKGQCLSLIAPNGFGKFTIAKFIASKFLNTDQLNDNPNLLVIKPDEKGNILIDEIRQINSFIKLKATSALETPRVIIIKNAEVLTKECQNLLLKPLEEPPRDVLFILCACSVQSLLPTIQSRIKILNLIPPTSKEIKQFFKDDFEEVKLSKSILISQGKLGMLWSLLSNQEHPLLEQIDSVKQFIKLNKFQKTSMINNLAKSDVTSFLDALYIVADSGFKNSVMSDQKQVIFWHKLKKATYLAKKESQLKGNNKLILTKLVLSI